MDEGAGGGALLKYSILGGCGMVMEVWNRGMENYMRGLCDFIRGVTYFN